MRVILAFVLVSAVLAVVRCDDPPVPQTPNQFVANVVITDQNSFMPTKQSGKYYYDFPNQRDRIDVSEYGTTITQVDLYEQGLSYQFAMGQCKCKPLSGALNPGNVPIGSTYRGTTTINGQSCSVWEWDSPFMADFVSTFYVNNQNEVVRANWTAVVGPMTDITLIDFSNIVDGAPGDAAFAIPSYCNGQCPSPPQPFQPSGSCPNSPDPMCQCAQSTELSFCTGVSWPVSNVIDIKTLDAFAQQTFNADMSILPFTPSQQCQDNIKAYICSFIFPQCAGSQNQMIFLPCADICMGCACNNFFGNCTAAPVNQYCTKYGGQNYC